MRISYSKEEIMAEGGALLKDFQKLKIEKKKDATRSEKDHSHKFLLKFNKSEEKFEIHCNHPQTVLEAITSKPDIQEKINCNKDKIILQKGKKHMDTAIATHFPCKRLGHRELLTLTQTKESVEVRDTDRCDFSVSGDEDCYVVYIQTEGGTNTKTKPLFKSNTMKKFSQLAVYGTGDMTLEDAIDGDGRFVKLGDFKLENMDEEGITVMRSDNIKYHDGGTFRISIERRKKADKTAATKERETCPTKAREETADGAEVAAMQNALAMPRMIPQEAAGGSEEFNKILKLLHKQFPEDEEESLSKTLNDIFSKVDFGKARQTFSEIFRMEMLFKLGKSVCKIGINNTCEGTGFVLLKRYVLTNAHLFDAVWYKNNVRPDIHITAVFGFKQANQQTTDFKVRIPFTDYNREMDYAILELVVNEGDESKVPPGLMKHCGPMPETGEACLIGYPSGDIQRFDPTCIIEKENRIREVNMHLQQFNDYMITLMSVCQVIEGQGIQNILSQSHPLYYEATSYHTFMFHGSSGSPVFDAHCRVFGLHTAGFVYNFGPKKDSVIEFARPLLLIFKKFVENLKNSNNSELLRAVEEELKDNEYRMEILTEEPMDEN